LKSGESKEVTHDDRPERYFRCAAEWLATILLVLKMPGFTGLQSLFRWKNAQLCESFTNLS
jgi:hypothetical protein